MVVRHAIGCRHRRRSSEQPPERWRRTRRGLRLDGRSARRGSLALVTPDIRRPQNSRLEEVWTSPLHGEKLDASDSMLRIAAHILPELSSPPKKRTKP